MNKTYSNFALGIFLILALRATAQDISVQSFAQLHNDLTARTLAPERDANGEVSALIRIVSTINGFVFEGGALGIVKADQKEGEWWIYIPTGSRTLTIRHPKLGVLRYYAYPVAIVGGSVYEMRLNHGYLEGKIKEQQILTEFVMIDSEPEGADVYLNTRWMGKTPFRAEQAEGRYEWRLEHESYLTDEGVFELKAGERQHLNLKLKPNHGSIEVSTQPEDGASISLNGIKLGKTTPALLEEIPTGEHFLTLTHPWYETKSENVTINPEKVNKVVFALEPNFALLTIDAEGDETVYINDSPKGTGTHTERYSPGVYRVEVRKEGHYSASKQITLERGGKERLQLIPEPILSNLKVLSTPEDAEIYLNGKRMGTTPFIARDLMLGEYDLELKKKGYRTYRKTVMLKDQLRNVVNVELVRADQISRSVNWMTVEEMTQAQKKEPRKVLIDVYTTWCGPCKMMDANTFTNKDVVKYINENFYAVKFNAESADPVKFKDQTFTNPNYDPNARGRNGVHEFSRALRVSAYPTIVYMDEELNMIAPIKGYQTPPQIELYLRFFSTDAYKEVQTQEEWEAYQNDFQASFK